MLASVLLLSASMLHPIAQDRACGPPPKGNRAWVGPKDYPTEARRAGLRGRVTFTLQISAQGCPTACVIVQSSGHEILDRKTCALMMERARFKPKLDESGAPVTAAWTNSIDWSF